MGSASSAVYASGCFFSPSVNDSASGGCLRRRKQHKLAFARYPDILHGKTCVFAATSRFSAHQSEVYYNKSVVKMQVSATKFKKYLHFFFKNPQFGAIFSIFPRKRPFKPVQQSKCKSIFPFSEADPSPFAVRDIILYIIM